MKLEIGRIYIKDIRLGKETAVKNGVLTVDQDGLIAMLKEDERIKDVKIDIAKPGEKVRIIPVKDVIEPSVKVSEDNNGFPGITAKQYQCGQGRTNVLYGAAVVTVGDIVGFQEGVIDMWGEGAKWTPFSKTFNLTIDISVKEDLTPDEMLTYKESEYKLRRALVKTALDALATEISETTHFEI